MEKLDGKVQFLCAGSPHSSYDLSELEKKFSALSGSVLVSRLITDQEFSDYAGVCDMLLLPYKKVTGSGALLASLTLGRGVVASDLPFFREILAQGSDAGRLVPLGDPIALATTICRYLQVSPETRESSARALADKYKWRDVVKPVVECLGNPPRK